MGYYARSGNTIGTNWTGKTGLIGLPYSIFNASLVAQVGTSVYDATALGPVISISEVEPAFQLAFPSVVSGFLRYIIRDSATTSKTITVSFRKSATGKISQSMFSAYNQNVTYGSVSSILLYSNDDHDSMYLDGDGSGVILRSNYSVSNASFYADKFKGTDTPQTNTVLSLVANYFDSTFINSGISSSVVTFPHTGAVVWLDLQNKKYKVNNFAVQNWPTNMNSISTGTPTNSLYTLSDGVNMFLIGRSSSTEQFSAICTVDLTTGIISDTSKMFAKNLSNNSTEEDAFGAQFFAVDGCPAWQENTTFYYTSISNSTNIGWRDMSTFTYANTSPVGNISTQTGQDTFGSIGSDGYLWFADWGHDDGGLFNYGNDDRLNTTKSNIQQIPSSYMN